MRILIICTPHRIWFGW